MVKVAVAGGTGNVATELLRPAIASGKHEITIFTRAMPKNRIPGVSYKVVDYTSLPSLTTALLGTHTCLSFLLTHLDADSLSQKTLLHACITAHVTRFAPSEWSLRNANGCPSYANKDTLASYLAELDAAGQLGGLQYCLFQPSVFMEYFAHGGRREEGCGLMTWPFFIDFGGRRGILVEGGEQLVGVTSVADVGEVLCLALGDERVWPRVGGICGGEITCKELLELGRELRGGEWSVEYVRGEDVERGVLSTDWVPLVDHPAFEGRDREKVSREFAAMFLEAARRGSWVVGREWNERFPEFRFRGVEEFLREAWEGVE